MKMYPDAEFLPRAPDPEEIILCEDEADAESENAPGAETTTLTSESTTLKSESTLKPETTTLESVTTTLESETSPREPEKPEETTKEISE